MDNIINRLHNLLNDTDNKRDDLPYKYLNRNKNQSIRALLNDLLRTPPPTNLSPLLRAYLDAQLMIRCSEILLAMGFQKLSTKLFQKTLNKSKRFSFVNISHQCLRELLLYYSLINYEAKKYRHYKAMYDSYTLLKTVEEKAESIFCEIKVLLKQTKTTINFEGHLQALAAIADTSDELNFRRYYYYSLLAIYDYQSSPQLQATCELALAYFNQLKIPVPSNYIFNFYLYLNPYLIKTGNYEFANKYLVQCQQLSTSSHINQSVTAFYQICNFIHAHQYELALECFQAHQRIKPRYQKLKEYFLLLDGYFEFLRLIGQVNFSRIKQFRITTFFNNLEKLSKDKGQMNINIRLLKMLLLLAQQKKMQLIEESEALRTYTVGLKKVKNIERIRYFLNIMGTIERTSFHPVAFARHTEPWHKKLLTTPLSESAMSLELEIIPFERLYKYVQKAL